MRKALTIAGSDSGGGAGIQADLKTFQRFGVFGTSALTLVTAQNTVGVQDVHLLPVEVIAAQIDSVVGDLRPDAVKTGALGSVSIIEAVADAVTRHGLAPLVVDPVMISKHGDGLLGPEAVEALRTRLFPHASLLTPNLHEAGALLGTALRDEDDMREAARALAALGPKAVLIKGGSLGGGEAFDVLWDGVDLHRFATPRVETRSTHGTGCTFSAAITAHLAQGLALGDAVGRAKVWIHRAIASAPGLGRGVGPVDHGVTPPFRAPCAAAQRRWRGAGRRRCPPPPSPW
ncbi:bifunctional hydroxymethylpyrimidine kinase/phosphomethylpyrimidine kinase [Vulgatibacter sp.]|uniref:bifunctional hydroxymethylpyrimidine kinase/phosphomethylpyrimidine kinase n=1 Tax=Vulgatibacter sp. TaxID=1971226 RepID=UPI0035665E56